MTPDFADVEAARLRTSNCNCRVLTSASDDMVPMVHCSKCIAQALRAAYQKGIGSNTKIVQYVDDAVKAYEDGFNTGQFSCCHDCADAQDDARKEGFEACREAAAKVANDYVPPRGRLADFGNNADIAKLIRNLRPEGGEAK